LPEEKLKLSRSSFTTTEALPTDYGTDSCITTAMLNVCRCRFCQSPGQHQLAATAADDERQRRERAQRGSRCSAAAAAATGGRRRGKKECVKSKSASSFFLTRSFTYLLTYPHSFSFLLTYFFYPKVKNVELKSN
jgi:hypothetical protein